MRKTKRSGSFLLCLLINILPNLEGLIPAAILLILPREEVSGLVGRRCAPFF